MHRTFGQPRLNRKNSPRVLRNHATVLAVPGLDCRPYRGQPFGAGVVKIKDGITN
jgi:hypothetical protein